MLHPGEIVTRERLLDEVWGWTNAVETRAVDIRIVELRKALDDDPARPRFVQTVIGEGYSFVGPVEGGT
jgi:DNA-binding response OmpR family regulator